MYRFPRNPRIPHCKQEYIITEATPGEAIIEKIVETVEIPVHFSSGTTDNGAGHPTIQPDGQTGHESMQHGGGLGNAEKGRTEENTSDEADTLNLYTGILTPVRIPLIAIPAIAALSLFGLIFPRKRRKRGKVDEKY